MLDLTDPMYSGRLSEDKCPVARKTFRTAVASVKSPTCVPVPKVKSVHKYLHTNHKAYTHRDIQSSLSLRDPTQLFDNIP